MFRKDGDPRMATVYEFGSFRLDADAEILLRDGQPIVLGQRAVALLRLLLECAGRPVSKNAFLDAVWPGLAVEDSNLTVQIAALRRALCEDGSGDWIETLPRRGYRYVGPAVATANPRAATPSTDLPLALPGKPSVAVLPFTNLSDDPLQEYFAEGMVEDIIAGLSRIKWLFVIARNSSFRQIFFASRFGISVWRGTASTDPLAGFIQSDANRLPV